MVVGLSAQSVRAARAAISCVFLLNGFGVGLWAVHIPAVQARLGLDEQTLGFALLTIAAGAMLSMPIAGAAASKLGTRRITIFSALAFLLATPILIAVPTMFALFLAAVLFGACNGTLDVAMNAHASDVERARGRPTMSSFHGFFSLGGLLGAGSAGLMLEMNLGDGRGALAVAGMSVLLLLAAARHLLPDGETSPEGGHFGWPKRPAVMLGLLALLCMAVEGAVADWSALLMTSHAGASATTAALGYSAFSVTMALCRFAGDGLVSRIGPQRMVLIGGLSIAAGLLLAVSAPLPLLSAAGFALVGIGAANVVPVIFAAAGRVPGVSASAGVATAATIGYAGFLLGPPVIGWMAAAIGLAGALGLLSAAGVLIAIGARTVQPGRVTRPAVQEA